ncbi:MAG: MATE family efflux transporter [FCB group bacterium]|nr:MATE family efflux transporter [FCB group bacterium]
MKYAKADLLGTMPVGKLLVKLSAPAIIGMVVNSLYNLVDTIYVGNIGQGEGTLSLAALAVCFPIQMFLLAVAQTVGIGSASIISRRLGEGRKEEAYRVASSSFVLIASLGLLLSITGLVFLTPILKLFGANDTILPFGRSYLSVILMGGVFWTITISSNNLARSEGNTKVAMTCMIIGACINIILDPVFIFVLDMGIKGAAIATVIAQFFAFLWITGYFRSGKSSLHISMKYLMPKLKRSLEIVRIGSPSFARVVAGSFLAIAVNNAVMYYGNGNEIYLAILGVTNRILIFALMPLFGLVQGLQPAVGYNYGALNFKRVRKAILYALGAATVITTFFYILFEVFPHYILDIFSNDMELITAGIPIMRMIVAVMPLIGFQIVGASVFQALGKAGIALVLSISRQLLFLVPLIFILPRFFSQQLDGVWWAFPGADILASTVTAIFFLREFAKMKNTG